MRGISTNPVHQQYPLMGMSGRSSVAHFYSMTHWTYLGKQQDGVRFVQIHPQVAQAIGVQTGDAVVVESPRGQASGTALIWEGIRQDTLFIPGWFGPRQQMATELGTPLYEPVSQLLDDQFYDNLSGQQAYKCFACRVRKA